MTENQINILGITREELVDIVRDAVRLEFSVQKARGDSPKIVDTEKFMTRSQVVELLSVSFVTLNKWSKRGVLVPKKIGGRVLYLKSEVFEKLDSAA